MLPIKSTVALRILKCRDRYAQVCWIESHCSRLYILNLTPLLHLINSLLEIFEFE